MKIALQGKETRERLADGPMPLDADPGLGQEPSVRLVQGHQALQVRRGKTAGELEMELGGAARHGAQYNPRPVDFTAIDAHLHVQPWDQLKPEVAARWRKTQKRFDDLLGIMKDPGLLLAMLDEARVEQAWLVNYPSHDLMGFDETTNDFVVTYCQAAPDRLIPVGGVHPRLCRDPERETRRILDLGIRVVKVHPPHQGVHPNAYLEGNEALRVLYAACEKNGIPVMIHTGTSIFPGARSKYGDPLGVEDVAIDFPRLNLILAHAGRPLWGEQAFFLARRFRQVYLDLSSIPPQSVLKFLPRLAEIADQVLFGTDWPAPGVPGIGENVRGFAALALPDDVKRKILYGNARALLARKGVPA